MEPGKDKPRGKKRPLHETSIASGISQPSAKRSFSSSTISVGSSSILLEDGANERGLMLAFLDNALSERKRGKSERYRELVTDIKSFSNPSSISITSTSKSKLSKSPLPSLKILQSYLQTLPHVASQLDKSHEDLVIALLDVPWTIMDVPEQGSDDVDPREIPKKLKGIPAAYVRCIGALCSAKSTLWIGKVLEKCIQAFRYDSFKALRLTSNYPNMTSSTAALTPETSESNPSPPQPSRSLHSLRIHYLLRHLIDLIPTISTTIGPYLERAFPSKRSKRDEQVVYVDNVLKLLEYCGGIEEKVTEMVVLRAIKLDIELQIDLEDWEADGAFEEIPFFQPSDPFDRHLLSPSPSPPRSRSSSISSISTTTSSSHSIDSDSDGESALGDGGGANEDEDEKKVVEKKESLNSIRERVRTLDGIMNSLLNFWEKRGEERSREVLMPFSENLPTESLDPKTNLFGDFNFTNSLNVGNRQRTFDLLLDIFDRTIFKAHNTSNVQFLVFWYSSLSPDFTDQFIGHLLEQALLSNSNSEDDTDSFNGAVSKVAALGYLASFLSRAKFIGKESVIHAVTVCCHFLDKGMQMYEEENMTRNPSNSNSNGSSSRGSAAKEMGWGNTIKLAKQYAVWYAVVQCLFYVFCFRSNDLIERRLINGEGDEFDDEVDFLEDVEGEGEDLFELSAILGNGPRRPVEGERWIPNLEALKRAISSKLNPLNVCSSSVCTQFASIATKTQFFYCHSIMAANHRSLTSSTSNASNGIGNGNGMTTRGISKAPPPSILLMKVLEEVELENSFPFDPFKLPMSRKFVDGLYREWVDDEDDYDEEEEEEDREEFRHLKVRRQEVDDGSEVLGKSLGSMSISPRRV